MNNIKWRLFPVSVFLVVGLTACNAHKTALKPFSDEPFDMESGALGGCDVSFPAKDWIRAYVLAPSVREDALNTVETPANDQQVWLRAILLTHDEASYRELREAESLLLNELKLSDTPPDGCETRELLDYILKLNQMLQKQKSEVVLLQRQLNEKSKEVDAQVSENKALEKKIEALTNIEHRMKQRSNAVVPEAVQ